MHNPYRSLNSIKIEFSGTDDAMMRSFIARQLRARVSHRSDGGGGETLGAYFVRSLVGCR